MKPPLTTTEEEDIALLARVAAGDQDALGAFYDRYASTLMAVAVRVLNNASAAEDVVQEVFVQIWEHASSYDRELGKPLSWAVVLTRNKAIDRLRGRIRGEKLMVRAAAEAVGDDFAPPKRLDADVSDRVQAALKELPTDQRQAIELAFYNGLSQTEIAERLAQPLGTIKARIRRGMYKLRDQLEGFL